MLVGALISRAFLPLNLLIANGSAQTPQAPDVSWSEARPANCRMS
jgi:hypothetical protein